MATQVMETCAGPEQRPYAGLLTVEPKQCRRQSFAQMKMSQAGSLEELARLRLILVDRWLEVADGAKGLARFAHLRHALELAEAYELAERGRDIRRLIQESPADRDELHEVSVELKIPSAAIDGYVGSLTGDDSWQDALTRLGATSPPSGDHSANLALVQQQMADHPLMFLITQVVYGPHGFPVQEVKDEGLHRDDGADAVGRGRLLPGERAAVLSCRRGSCRVSSAECRHLAAIRALALRRRLRTSPYAGTSGAPGWNRTSDTRFRKPAEGVTGRDRPCAIVLHGPRLWRGAVLARVQP